MRKLHFTFILSKIHNESIYLTNSFNYFNKSKITNQKNHEKTNLNFHSVVRIIYFIKC
jgi:hypothetical protein